MPGNALILLVVLVVATSVGFGVRRYNGHFRGAAKAPGTTSAGAATGSAAASTASSGGAASGDAAGVLAQPGAEALTSDDLAAPLGEVATLLQFSSAFCAPCRVARRVLAEVAELLPGVEHVEIDAEHHLDLVRRLGVVRTPTTFVLDPSGVVVTRASGAPTKPQVIAALGLVDTGNTKE